MSEVRKKNSVTAVEIAEVDTELGNVNPLH